MKEAPLAHVEVLLLFHPLMQSGGARRVPAALCEKAAQGRMTLDVYGRPAKSELNGAPVLEDMRIEVDGEDIEAKLPGNIVDEVANYVLADA